MDRQNMDRHEKLLSYKKIEYDIYNEILLSHIKEWNIAICNNMDGPMDSHSEVKTKTNIIWYHLYVKSKKRYKWT